MADLVKCMVYAGTAQVLVDCTREEMLLQIAEVEANGDRWIDLTTFDPVGPGSITTVKLDSIYAVASGKVQFQAPNLEDVKRMTGGMIP